jgi:hypothetical protein
VTGSRVYYSYVCLKKIGPYELPVNYVGIFDVSSPANPQMLGLVGLGASDIATHLRANGNLAYAGSLADLLVIDFSSPANPAVTRYPYGSLDFQAVDNRFYLASRENGLVIVDLSAPSNPTVVGTYDVGTGAIDEVQARPPYLYAAGGKDQLQVIDISSPKTPVVKKAISDAGQTLVVTGNLAYLNQYNFNGLKIWDLSNPIDPVLKGSLNYENWQYSTFHALAILGSYAYVGGEGIGILDIHDPTQPAYLGSTLTDLHVVRDMQTAGNLVYTAAGEAGLVILDATDVLNPQMVGQYIYDKYAFAKGVAVSGNMAYLTDDLQGLLILDVQDPAHPSLVGQFPISDGSDFRQVQVIDHLAYIADYKHGLLILDVSDPAHPQLYHSYDLPGGAAGLDVVGEYIYVASSGSCLNVLRLWNNTLQFLPLIGG